MDAPAKSLIASVTVEMRAGETSVSVHLLQASLKLSYAQTAGVQRDNFLVEDRPANLPLGGQCGPYSGSKHSIDHQDQHF